MLQQMLRRKLKWESDDRVAFRLYKWKNARCSNTVELRLVRPAAAAANFFAVAMTSSILSIFFKIW